MTTLLVCALQLFSCCMQRLEVISCSGFVGCFDGHCAHTWHMSAKQLWPSLLQGPMLAAAVAAAAVAAGLAAILAAAAQACLISSPLFHVVCTVC
jgi:hypothetical protein